MDSSPAHPFDIGTLVAGRYRIEGRLGEGGYGVVLRATQLPLGIPVALKILTSALRTDAEGLGRFRREAEFAQRLSHPNTVRILDIGVGENGLPFIAWEFLEGKTLADVLVGGRLAPDRVARIAMQVLKSLLEAHGFGIVHRDIKPSNIFLCEFVGESDFVKVLDFGIAKEISGRSTSPPLTQPGQVVGTVCYMAPEQLLGQPTTPASDLYALGLVMAEALSGQTVAHGATNGEIMQRHLSEKPHVLPPEVEQSPLRRVIERAIQKKLALRYPTATEMLNDLVAIPPFSATASTALPSLAPTQPHAIQPSPSAYSARQAAVSPALLPPYNSGGHATPVPPYAQVAPTGLGKAPTLAPAPSLVPAPPPLVRSASSPRTPSGRGALWRMLLLVLGAAACVLVGAAGVILLGPPYPPEPRSRALPDPTATATASKTTISGPPVLLDGSHSNAGWSVMIHLREPALEIWYKRPTDPEFVSTGRSQWARKNGTGELLAETSVGFPKIRGRVAFLIRYRDLAGVMKGPYPAVFDTDATRIAELRRSLGDPTSSWGSCATNGYRGGRSSCEFMALLDGWEVFRSLRFSADNETLNQSVAIPDRDLMSYPAPGFNSEYDIPRTTSVVWAELTFIDGTRLRHRITVRHLGPT